MVDLTGITALVAAVGVLFGVIYYVFDIGHQVKVRKTDLIMRLHLHTCSEEFVTAYQKILNLKFDDYEDFVNKYGPLSADGPEQKAITMISFFMEGVGVLLHQGLADIDAIRELFPVEKGWTKLKPLLTGVRKDTDNLEAWKWYEYLYDEVKKREKSLSRRPSRLR